MSAFLNRNLTALTILASIALGFLFPDIGNHWRPYVAYFLMLLMFSTVLTIRPKDILESARNVKALAYTLFIVFVFVPALALIGKPLFSPIEFAGIMLAFCAPSAIATPFFASVFKGDTASGLVISIVTNLLAILTIPLTMFLAIGATISLDLTWMTLNLAEVILVPIALALLVQKIFHIDMSRLSRYTSKTNLMLLLFIIWGSISPGTTYAKGNPTQFLWLNLFILPSLTISFIVAYAVGSRNDHKRAITAGIAASVKNAALPLVIATTLFNSEILPPLVANLIAQSLILVALGTFSKEK